MFYIFAYLSVFSPTILLQSRVLDTPLAPTIGALPICLVNVCAVVPRPGTTLHAFVRDIPHPTFPAMDAVPPARVIIPDGTEGDGDGGGGRLKWSEKSSHTLPLLAQKLHRANVEPFTWDAFQESDIRFITSAFPHRNFLRTVYPLNTAVKPNPVIPPTGHSNRVMSPNPNPPSDLWSDQDKYLALSSSGGLGRNGSMNDWGFGHNVNHTISTNDTANYPTCLVPRTLVTTLGDVELSSSSLINRTGALSHTVSTSNTTGQLNLAIGPIAIGLKVELQYPKLSPPQHLLSGRETSLAISNFGSLRHGRSVSSWDLGRIRSVFKWIFRRSNVASHAKHRPRPSFSFTRRLFKIRLLFKTAQLLVQPQCRASEKAFYLLNETCHIAGSTDDSLQDPPSPTAAADWPFLSLPQCMQIDTCMNPLYSPPSTKRAVGSHAALQPQCLLADKAFHLLNDTCIPVPEDEPFTPTFKVELPIFNAIPFRPISVNSLPCLAPNKDQNCGFYYAPPSLDMALEWDIRSQAALVAQETPAFLSIIPDFELPTCRRHRGFSLGVNVCSPPTPLPHKTVFANPRLFPIGMRYLIVITLAVLGKAIPLAKRDRQSEGWFALAVALAALGQAFSLAKFKRFEGPDMEALPAVPKPEEAPVKTGVAVTLATLRRTFLLVKFKIFEGLLHIKAHPGVPKLEEVKAVVAATMTSLGQAFSLAKFKGFEGLLHTKAAPAIPKFKEMKTVVAATLASLGQAFSLMKFKRFKRPPHTKAPPAVPKLAEAPLNTAAGGLVDVNIVSEDVPASAAPKPTPSPSPTKAKARMVAGRRVQPARKSKKTSLSTSASGLEASSSTGSVVGKGRSPKRSKQT